jgi:RND family efflux transporter MFP subunit
MPTHEGHDMSTMAATQDMAGMAGMPAMEPSPAGSESGVYISPARQQLIGVRTATVGREDVAEPIRAVGALAYDETRITQVHTKIAGWIDELFVDFAGKPIQKGQPLFTIYSPDLVATENEYLLARRAQRQLEASRFEETRQGATSLVAAARRRLALWDVPDAVIAELERTGEARRTVTVYAPSAGVVLERNAFGGQYVTPELALFKLADLSTVWVIGQVPEADAGRVQLGQSVTIELSNAPGTRPFRGRLTFIYPEVDPATRRVRVRVELPNPGLTLKPDTFVTLTIDAPPSNALAVPAEAVIDTGLQRYVILARDQGYFEPRVINTGAPAKGYYPVVSGLVAGDRVVTSAQFLIDSESNLQAAMQAMAGMPGMDMASHASGASDARR